MNKANLISCKNCEDDPNKCSSTADDGSSQAGQQGLPVNAEEWANSLDCFVKYQDKGVASRDSVNESWRVNVFGARSSTVEFSVVVIEGPEESVNFIVSILGHIELFVAY